ncbi:MAG: hypothetical protein SVM80_08995 [Halobacteriota archaeon]|nr:hypothetical protein [Halobacteriota archaeon]
MAGFPDYQAPQMPMGGSGAIPGGGGGFDIGENQIQMFGMVVGMLLNSAEEKYRETLRNVDGTTILVDFGDMGAMVIKVKENTIVTYTGKVDNPTLSVVIKKEPNELLEMIAPAISPILGPVMPYAMPLIMEGVTIRGVLSMVFHLIPALPSMLPVVRLIGGGLLKRTAVIKGSIAPVLPIAEVFLIPFLTGEEDPEFLEQKARDMREFGTGPPPGWGI